MKSCWFVQEKVIINLICIEMNTATQSQDTKSQHALVDENGELNLLLQEAFITPEGLENDYTNYSHLFFDLS